MTKDHKILSLQLTAEELHELDQEAQAPPFLSNRSDYCRSILAGRHKMRIEAAPQAQSLIDQHTRQLAELEQDYQQQLEILQEQFDQQHDQLIQCQKQLRVLEQQIRTTIQQQEQQQKTAQQAYDQLLIQFKVEEALLQKEKERHQATNCQLTECKQALQQAKRQGKQLEQELQEAKSLVNTVESVSKGISKVVANNPSFVQAISDNGLKGLFSGKNKPDPLPSPVQPPSKETLLGQSIYRDFPGDKLTPVMVLIPFLRDNPQELAALVASPGYKAYHKQFKQRIPKTDPLK